jgi:hypothetical protein
MLFNYAPFALSLSKGAHPRPFDKLRANGLFLTKRAVLGQIDFFVIFKYHMPARLREDGEMKQFVSVFLTIIPTITSYLS